MTRAFCSVSTVSPKQPRNLLFFFFFVKVWITAQRMRSSSLTEQASLDKHRLHVSDMFSASVASTRSAKWNRLIRSPRNATTTARNNKTNPLCRLRCWKFQTRDLKIQFVTLREFFFPPSLLLSVALCAFWLMAAHLVTDDLCFTETSSVLLTVPVWHPDWGHAWEPWLHPALSLLSLTPLPPPSLVLLTPPPHSSLCVCSPNIFLLWLAIVFFPQPV